MPSLEDQGGVANFFNSVLPHFPKGKVTTLEIGGTRKSGGLLHPFIDQIRFRRTVKNLLPALIHLNPSLNPKSFFRDGLFAWQGKKYGATLVVFWRGWDKNFEVEIEKKYMWFFHQAFAHSDAFIVLSSEFEQKLRDWGVKTPIYQETTSVADELIKGFDVQGKWTDVDRLSQIKILFLARLERVKGVFETIHAFKLLVDKGFPVYLTIAGDGKIRQELEKFARFLNLPPQLVNFTGDIRGDDKISVFAKHHIFCFPTYHGEGMPNSVLEAMAFGLPVVTRPVGGLRDIFLEGKMGLFVHGKNPVEIAYAIEKLITNRNLMLQMSEFNHNFAKKHFMASNVAKRLLNIYSSTIDAKSKCN